MNDIVYITSYYKLITRISASYQEVIYKGSVIFDNKNFDTREYMHNGFLNTLCFIFNLHTRIHLER